jgi:hypothetical protein
VSTDVVPLPTLSIASCSSSVATHALLRKVAASVEGIADSETVLLSSILDAEAKRPFFAVNEGTKLSKLRQYSRTVKSDFVCVCDPDLEVQSAATLAVVAAAINVANSGCEIVAYGLLKCRDDGTVLSRVIAIDKWLSHRVLRPALWGCGVGITIPGQFMVFSTSMLQRIDPAVDSYLDDLYLGWIARSNSVRVLRVPVVVGYEESRSAWASLLTQRLRWMRGFFSLVAHLARQPKAIGLLAVHFAAYHGLPILWLLCLVALAILAPAVAVAFFATSAVLASLLSRQSLVVATMFFLLFPMLHCVVALLWWIPISHERLQQR